MFCVRAASRCSFGSTALLGLAAALLFLRGPLGFAADQPQWGERYSRNMVSPETGLPEACDPASGAHILWSASLGNNAYGSAIVAGGKVLIGANNSEPRDPRHQGDRAVLLCLDEKTGALCWQLVTPRIGGDDYLDWPDIGICSAPTVEGNRLYLLTNRSEAVCVDLNGLADGNDGPYVDEGRHMSEADSPAMVPGPLDADIIWLFDLPSEVGTYPHDSPFTSMLLDGSYLYLNSCNGVDNTHAVVRRPEAPSLIALDKATGKLVGKDAEGMGARIFHCIWSPPALGTVDGNRLLFFGGPDGVCYAFKALSAEPADAPRTFERVWRFDCDPSAPKEDIHQYLKNYNESPSVIMGMPVFYKSRVYVTVGGDIWWGKRLAWLKCIDASKTGEVTESALLWSYPLERHSTATPAIADGLVFVTDCGGKLHCVDAESGQPYWTHDMGKEMWGSALAADEKVYVGARNGSLAILAAAKEKKLIGTVQFDSEIAATPTVANGVLYVPTLTRLYAVK